MKVGVVGGGIIGSCCAWRLAERGHMVTLFDARSLGHALGSSHGKSRIVRRTYADPFYTAIMSEAYPMWAEVEGKTTSNLLNECGLLLFGREEAPMIAEAEQSMAEEGIPFKRVATIARGPKLFPGECGLLVPEGGWIAADKAHAAIRRLAYHFGTENSSRDVQSLEELKSFDTFILAAGPWIKQWVPNLDVTVTVQTFAYAKTPMLVGGPVWIHAVDHLFYGFPSEPGVTSVKIGVHVPGKPLDDPEADRTPGSAHLAAIRSEALERFDSLDTGLTGQRCLYTSTPDEDFRIGRHGDRGWFISACSGHAFKMGPWMGKLMADLVEEKQDLADWPRFAWPRV